jgi:hypothetical protein
LGDPLEDPWRRLNIKFHARDGSMTCRTQGALPPKDKRGIRHRRRMAGRRPDGDEDVKDAIEQKPSNGPIPARSAGTRRDGADQFSG